MEVIAMRTSFDRIIARDEAAGKHTTVYGIAKRVGLPMHTAYRWANGQYKTAPLDTLELLCVCLDCTPNDLLLTGNSGEGNGDE
jgi:DNA-binding Xre family transcriptional regulator